MCLIWISSQKKFNLNRIIIIFFNCTGVYAWGYILVSSNDKAFFFLGWETVMIKLDFYSC